MIVCHHKQSAMQVFFLVFNTNSRLYIAIVSMLYCWYVTEKGNKKVLVSFCVEFCMF